MINVQNFYSRLTPLYHLIYPDWEKSIKHQGEIIDSVIQEIFGGGARDVLDVSCGIGTQALGLATIGYNVTASDLSVEEVDRAKQEAHDRNLTIDFSVADMRKAFNHHKQQFDIVISCDNSIPHLLTDEDILNAIKQFYKCTRPSGNCIITVRDYERENLSHQQIKPYGIREKNNIRWLLWQVWDPHPPMYDVTFYFVEDHGKSTCKTHALRATYYAIGIPKIIAMMKQAGFDNVHRLDDRYFQPMIIGIKKSYK